MKGAFTMEVRLLASSGTLAASRLPMDLLSRVCNRTQPLCYSIQNTKFPVKSRTNEDQKGGEAKSHDGNTTAG